MFNVTRFFHCIYSQLTQIRFNTPWKLLLACSPITSVLLHPNYSSVFFLLWVSFDLVVQVDTPLATGSWFAFYLTGHFFLAFSAGSFLSGWSLNVGVSHGTLSIFSPPPNYRIQWHGFIYYLYADRISWDSHLCVTPPISYQSWSVWSKEDGRSDGLLLPSHSVVSASFFLLDHFL